MTDEMVYIKDSNQNYLIGPDGRIISTRTGKELSHFVREGTSVQMVYLYLNRKRVVRSIARLVMEHFSDDFDEYRLIQHIDGDESNNHISNLTYRFAYIPKYRLRGWPRGIRVFDQTTQTLYHSAREAARVLGGNPRGVYRCIYGEQDTYMGHKLELYDKPEIVYNNRIFEDDVDPWLSGGSHEEDIYEYQ